MQIRATAKFDDEMERVMKQQDNTAATNRRIEGKKDVRGASSSETLFCIVFFNNKVILKFSLKFVVLLFFVITITWFQIGGRS